MHGEGRAATGNGGFQKFVTSRIFVRRQIVKKRKEPHLRVILALAAIIFTIIDGGGAYALGGGALGGNRERVLISSDIGGSDEDDIQSMIHYLLYSDLFDTEGLISSPPHKGRKKDIFKVIDKYEKDYANLKSYSAKYPSGDYLRSISKQGALSAAPEKGYSKATEGSRWIIHCAKKKDPRPLYVLVWGSISDLAQALHDDASIKKKIRVYFIASWNLRQDQNAFKYIDKNHSDLWLIYSDTTFRGWYMGGEQSGNLENKSFVQSHINGHGELGDYFSVLKGGGIKMGDTPSVSYLLRGNPDDPTKESWGGRFVKRAGRANWWIDDPDKAFAESGKAGAKTVNKWREEYLGDFQKRMDRCKDKAAVSETGKSVYLFSSFRGNGEDGLHLAYSFDGYKWTDIGKTFLKPKVGVSKLMRDPCIVQGPNGRFHMVWTPGWGEKGIGYAHSMDLVNWSQQKYIEVMAHEPKTMNAWAPEIFYDEPNERYIIYWASTIPGRFPGGDHPKERNHRMYYVTTKDFESFSKTKFFFDPGYSVIDSIIIKRTNGYVLVLKDERVAMRRLRVAFGRDVLGPFQNISEPFAEQYSEGPSAMKIGDEWFVYFDLYHKKKYGAKKTRDFKTWTDVTEQVSFPKGHRHGTILQVSQEILDGLKRAAK